MSTTATPTRTPVLHRELQTLETFGVSIAMVEPTFSLALFAGAPAVFIGSGAPLAFICAAIGLILVGGSFAYLSRYFNTAGSVYGLAGSTIGPRAGFFSGWAVIGTYVIFTASSSVIAGYFAVLFCKDTGIWPGADYLPFAIVFLGAQYVLANRRIRLASRVMLSIEGVSIIVMLFVVIVVVAKLIGGSHGHHFTLKVFTLPSGTSFHELLLAAVFGFAAFAGFEGAATLGEETQNARRNVPKAFMIVIGSMVVLFVVVTAVIAMAFGVSKAGGAALATNAGPLFAVSRGYVSSTAAEVLEIGCMVSGFSGALATMTGASRMVFALARDGRPQSRLAAVGDLGEPRLAILIVFVIALILAIVVRIVAVSGLHVAFYFGSIGTLSLLAAYAIVTLGAAKHLRASRGSRGLALAAVPLLGFVFVIYLMYNELYPVPASPYNIFPYIVGGWLLVGLLIIVAVPGLAARMGTGLANTETALESTEGGSATSLAPQAEPTHV